MKIFENKVGRPSNEIKLLRKMFYISIISMIISLMAIVLSCIATVKNVADKSKGATTTPTISVTSNGGSKSGTTGDWTNLWEYKTTGKYTITYAVKNNSSGSVYYRYFAFDGKSGSLDYNGKDKNGKFSDDPNTCNLAISKSKTAKINKTINLSSSSKSVKAVLKLYNSKTDCSNDNKGKNSSVAKNEMLNQVKSNSTSDTSQAVSFLEWLINFFKKLFGIKDEEPGTGSNRTTAKTTKVSTTKTTAPSNSMTLTCPATATVNQKFTCSTNLTGVTISVTKEGLASGFNTSFTTTSSDKTKQSKYTKTGTITVTAEKSGYVKKTVNVKIVSQTTTKATTVKSTTASNKTVNKIINIIGGESHYCNKSGSTYKLPNSDILLIQIAYSQIGYREKASNSNRDACTSNSGSSNYQKYGNNGSPWCDRFVVWSLKKAGVTSGIVNAGNSTGMKNWAINNGKWYTDTSKRHTGDLVKYDGHIGILYHDGSSWKVIHGNWDNAVTVSSISLSGKKLEGYISLKGITY